MGKPADSILVQIAQYAEAAERMAKGDLRVSFDVDAQEEVGRLGRALLGLRRSFAGKLQATAELNNTMAKIVEGLTLDEILCHVYESFEPLIPYDRIGLSLLSEDATVARAYWARSKAAELSIAAGYEASLLGSSLERVMETRRPRIINDLEHYLTHHPRSETTRLIVKEGMRSSLTCPLFAFGRPVGFIFFSSMKPLTYGYDHVELFLDVARQLSVAIEKSRLHERLVGLNEDKDRFLGIAAHDLRGPLSASKGFLELLHDGELGPVTEAQQKALSMLRGNCDEMLALINDLLDMSAINSGHLSLRPSQTDLRDLLSACAELNDALARSRSMVIKIQCQDELPLIDVDPRRLKQVVSNLVSNAMKYSGPDTVITVGARRHGDEVEIYVSDQGSGIPAEELPKLFTEFGKTTVRPVRGERSFGLGLAIVKRIAEAHGGRVDVRSQVGKGSTFSVYLSLESS